MSEEEEESIEPTQSGVITWIAYLVLISVLGTFVTLVACPSLRPKQLEPMLEPVDQVIEECHELVYNYLYDSNSNDSDHANSEFDWETNTEAIKIRIQEVDKRIEQLEVKIKSIPPASVDNAGFHIPERLIRKSPKESSAQLLSKIETAMLALVKKSRELTIIKYQNILIQELNKARNSQSRRIEESKTSSSHPATVGSVLQDLHRLVPFKLVKLLSVADKLSMRKRANLMALYIEKCHQLSWVLKVNNPFTVHKRLTSAFSLIFDIHQGKDLGETKNETKTSVERRRAIFINAAQQPISKFIRNFRAFLQ